MRKTTVTIAAVMALGLSAIQSSAATLIFDDFDINQEVADSPLAPVTTSDTIAFDTSPFGGVGGTRKLEVENIQNPGSDRFATQLLTATGALRFSNTDGSTGTGTLEYTNVGDLQLGTGAGFFLFEIGSFDHIANFTVTVEDTDGLVSTYQEVLLPGFDPKLRFSEFGGAADFNSVARLTFMIDSENVPGFGPQYKTDGNLASISIGAVPLPASALLLLGGLGGLGAMRRRKKAA